MPRGSGMPAGFRGSEAVDYYDFGVRVRVSAPPASEVISASEFSQSMSRSGSSSGGGFGQASPPPVSGTLSAAQASAAEQAVGAFWTALSSNSGRAVERTVVPSQRDCVAGFVQGSKFKFKISSLRITAARPAGPGKATVSFPWNPTLPNGRPTAPSSLVGQYPRSSPCDWRVALAAPIGRVGALVLHLRRGARGPDVTAETVVRPGRCAAFRPR